ncbi:MULTISPECIES: GPP34 family phosphoprotein [Actinopolyspora]|uniref:Golgi phosphoprotein 3 (GPP34) n=1 Tax=Actinopolyspora saharensis TaxID=995062 RepID=A0A1H1G0P0_9ACTN|nr:MULTISPECIES: GPP34 family phosphoprotein [Actinopolyspora]NHD16282.1 GPP34 family phosphoprotein [Actinopolyspora sp. BKK2]NHE75855.1 GPP34 family phosphoprotein [Actinopolyspora sp. BKK1]SDR06797.1 Golgi phosphoprotein 3 (GPP34) [Actinopolyspora saharensis]
MRRVNDRSRTAFGLPGELVLLLHKPHGGHHSAHPDVAVAAAEVAELVLRGHATITDLGLSGSGMRLDDVEPGGLEWLDDALDQLRRKVRRSTGAVALGSWFHSRNGVFKRYRDRMARDGPLWAERRKVFGVEYSKYFPDSEIRGALVQELGEVARQERAVDNRLALLAAIVHGTGLLSELGMDRSERRVIKSLARGEKLGEAVDATVGAARAAIVVAGAAAATGGGDGGGG